MTNKKFNRYSFLLERTAKRVKQFAQSAFLENDFGVTVDQWSVLKILNEEGPVPGKLVAERTNKDHPTLSRIIDKLEIKNLVERKDHPNDRRVCLLCLTKDAKDLIHTIEPEIDDIRMHAWKNLTEEDFEHFNRILNKIYTNLK
ncbi:MAG TPA: MarR family transcriptional regulator [Candidatus Sphingobacterium stercoripullorum]|uniref:MarR family transcriptional regulator n=1 Tax=Candidatus Sphingobacterium stercoripullorum TaxID=2838759 RepID=A0A9D1WA11_9SPHI|nr:MarR family transcriptional regulator [Candidatus Sphingobacterium stercoripullorum]HLR48993.1 MarR family transcriptional regulator [Candidatus Sphingobacterium stercoripullorum]